MLQEERQPLDLLNIMENEEDVLELRYQNKTSDYLQQEIDKIFNDVKQLLSITESNEFKTLNLEDENQKKLYFDVLKEMEIKREKIKILLNSLENMQKMKEKHKKKKEKQDKQNQLNVFRYNKELYSKFKNENNDMFEVPELFKNIYETFEKIYALGINDEDKQLEFYSRNLKQ